MINVTEPFEIVCIMDNVVTATDHDGSIQKYELNDDGSASDGEWMEITAIQSLEEYMNSN